MNIITKTLGRRHVRQFIILLVADVLVFSTTNAKTVASPLLIVGFVLLMATFYQLMYGLLAALELYGLHWRKPQRLALYFTAFAGVLVALQSIGELSLRDVLVLLPLAALGYFYSSFGKQSV